MMEMDGSRYRSMSPEGVEVFSEGTSNGYKAFLRETGTPYIIWNAERVGTGS